VELDKFKQSITFRPVQPYSLFFRLQSFNSQWLTWRNRQWRDRNYQRIYDDVRTLKIESMLFVVSAQTAPQRSANSKCAFLFESGQRVSIITTVRCEHTLLLLFWAKEKRFAVCF
jgi:hypothetical protein